MFPSIQRHDHKEAVMSGKKNGFIQRVILAHHFRAKRSVVHSLGFTKPS